MKSVTVPFFISHQGCLHNCIFCDQRIISGAFGQLPTGYEIIDKVRTWQRSAGHCTLDVAFFGGTFTALAVDMQEQLLGPLQPLLAAGEINSVRISTRPDCINADHVGWLTERGVRIIELGVQSMDNNVLAAAGRGHDAAASDAAIRCVSKHGLSVGAQLMPGLPGDTPANSLRSLECVMAAGADFVRIYPALVLRGTELARRFEAGEYSPLSLDKGISLCKVLLHTALKAGVGVVRIGLQADEGLNSGSVKAGCYHPAFGQLVRSELYYDLLCLLAADLPDAAPFSIRCHPSRISDVIGQGRVNLIRLSKKCRELEVKPDVSLLQEELAVQCLDQRIKGHIVSDLHFNINEV
ncbi:MAG: hypothetical protein A2X83_13105 [Desulfuromonadales bacterium GWD2_54_10]|nr:MAG: hypothetical protein A2X83_13105 [Desulfuromonadales bacterium GWD2_54_10]